MGRDKAKTRGAVPLDRGWAWFIVLGVFVNQMFVVGGARSFGVIFVHMMEYYDATSTSSSLAIALMAFGLTLYSPVATHIGKMYTFRMVAMIGALAQGLSFFLAAFAPNIYAASLLIGLIDGIGVGFLFAPSISALGQYFVKHRSLAIGIASAGTSAGQLMIPLLVRYLLDEYGFSGCMMIYGAVTWHCLVASALMRPQSFYPKGIIQEDEPDEQDKSSNSTENLKTVTTAQTDLDEDEYGSEGLDTAKIETERDCPGGPNCTGKTTSKCNCDEQKLNSSENVHSDINGDIFGNNKLDQDIPNDHSDDETSTLRSKHSEIDVDDQNEKKNKCSDNALLNTFKSMFDPKIIKRPLFIFYVISICCANTAVYNSIAFLPAIAQETGLTKQQASFILAISGFADIPGRIFSSVFNNFQFFSTRHLMSIALVVIIGVNSVCLLMPSFASLMAMGITLGCCGGVYMALFPVYLLEFMGPKEFPSAFALTMMLNGIGNLLLPLVAGAIYDTIGTYLVFSWICIVMESIAVVFYQLYPVGKRLEERKLKKSAKHENHNEKVA